MMKKLLLTFIALIVCFSVAHVDASAASYDPAKTTKVTKVYVKAHTKSKVRYTIPKGKAVKVIGGVAMGGGQDDIGYAERYGYYKVTYKNKVGYVKEGQLKFNNPYSWAPGIKTAAKKMAKKAADGHSYRYTKAYKVGSQGFYYLELKYGNTWQTVYTINCKTAWAHA